MTNTPETATAACHDLGLSAKEVDHIFFPNNEDRDSDRAKKICVTCPLRQACLDGAIERQEIFGIWGGMTRKERRVEMRNRGLRVRKSRWNHEGAA